MNESITSQLEDARFEMDAFRPRLIEAETAGARMDALLAFIEFWLGPRQPSYGESLQALSERPLPMPLKRLYQFAGRWPQGGRAEPIEFSVPALSHQDTLVALDKLRTTDDGKVLFVDENQSVWECSTLPDGEDPPVWCHGDHVNEEGDWFTGEKLVCPSLSRFLATFVLQELTFGSRVHFWDEDLSALFAMESASKVPVWIDGPYVHGNKQSFYLWGDVLVEDRYGDLVFAANRPEGVDFLKANQCPARKIEISMEPAWTLSILPDGSTSLRYRNGPTVEAVESPVGTFDFRDLLAVITARVTDEGHYERNPVVFFFRPGQSGGVPGMHLHDGEFVTGLFRFALARATEGNETLERRFAAEWPL